MKTNLFSILLSLLKSFFTAKKFFLLAAFFATGYYVKTKFFKSNSRTKERTERNSRSIIATPEALFPIESKRELCLIFLKIYNVPQEIIDKIFLIPESAIPRKNFLFLSFYQNGFINPKDGMHKPIILNANLTAFFYSLNPFQRENKD